MTDAASLLLLAVFFGGALMLGIAALVVLRSGAEAAPAGLAPAADESGRWTVGAALPLAAGGAARPRQTELRRHLGEAGFDHAWAVQIFYLIKLLSTVLGVVVGLALTMLPILSSLPLLQRVLVIAVPGLLAYFLPTMLLDRRRAAWRRRIEVAIPDALDFMLVCVEAGQSIDMAAARVAVELESVHPDLAARFSDLTKELAAGASREEAFLHLAQVTDSSDLRQYATLVVQSSKLGTPMAQTLRIFAGDLRDRRIRRIEERANVLPTKMTLGTMMFTVPPLLILLMTPAIYRLLTVL